MDARYKGVCLAVLALCSVAATDRSRNFVVTAPTHEIAVKVAQQAEIYRHKLAVEWLGKPLPNWRQPCTVEVTVGQIGAGGATTFVFTGSSVGDYKMKIQGPLDRILDSVLPHEINHTIFAEHFRRPMPRWADEGAATFVEDESERRRQMLLAMQVLKTNRRIPLRSLLSIMDYPKDIQDVLHLYAEGYVLVELLIQNGGRSKFLAFLKAANSDGWDRALNTFYGHRGVDFLEREWNQWVLAGCPAKVAPEGTLLASVEVPVAKKQTPELARAQAPDREPVSIEDLAEKAPLMASAHPAPAKRGAGLQAPAPARRQAVTEPKMLAQVELGSKSSFNSQRARQLTSNFAAGDQSPAKATRIAAAVREEPEFVEDEPEPVIRPNRPARAALPRSPVRPLATPLLRLDSRPQYGQARPFPRGEAFSLRGDE